MNRRAFIGGLLASAAVRTWPFRVFSFRSEIQIPEVIPAVIGEWVDYYTSWQPLTLKDLRIMRAQLMGSAILPRCDGKFYSEDFLTLR